MHSSRKLHNQGFEISHIPSTPLVFDFPVHQKRHTVYVQERTGRGSAKIVSLEIYRWSSRTRSYVQMLHFCNRV